MDAEQPAPPRWRRFLPWLGIVAAGEVVVYAAWAWLGYVQRQSLRSGAGFPDFFAYYAAGRQELADGFARLYDPALQQHYQQLVTGGGTRLLPYINPPYLAPLWLPFATLGFRAAYVTWVLLSAAAVIAALALLVRAAGLRGAAAWAAGLLVAAWFPTLGMLLQGQTDGFVLLGIALAAAAWTAGAERRAGAAAVLTLLRPHVTFLLPVLLLVRSWSRAFAAWAAALAVLLLASLALVGLGGWRDYLATVLPWAAHGHSGYALAGQTAYSLRGLLAFLGSTGSLVAVAVAALAVAVLLARGPGRRRLDLAIAAAGSVVLSPYQNLHDLLLLGAALILAAGLLAAGELRWRPAGWAALAACYLGVDAALFGAPLPAALTSLLLLLYLAGERLAGLGAPRRAGSSASNFTTHQPDVRNADVRL